MLILASGIIGFNLVKAHIIGQALAQNASPKQTIATADGEIRRLAAADQCRRHAARGARRGCHDRSRRLVRTINFHSGQEIDSGATLVQLNADSDIAQQQALAAAADLAEVVYKRDQEQFQAQAISQAQVDSDAADLKNKRAQEAAQAALVAKKTLRAPFAGAARHHYAQSRAVPESGRQSRDPAAAGSHPGGFPPAAAGLSRIAVGQPVTLTADTWPGVTFAGHITAVNPLVDSATRNVQVEAAVDNHARQLFPGMFGHLQVAAGKLVHALTLPQSAITYNPYGATVFLVIPDASNGRPDGQTDLRDPRGHPRRSGAGADGREGRRCGGERPAS